MHTQLVGRSIGRFALAALTGIVGVSAGGPTGKHLAPPRNPPTNPSQGATAYWTVDPNGTADFTTIQSAIDSSQVLPGDWIVLAPTVFVEDVRVHKSVVIVGNPGSIVVPATSNPDDPSCGTATQSACATHVFRIQADNVTITGVVIDGDNPALPGVPDARTAVVMDDSYGNGIWNNITVLGTTVRNCYLAGLLVGGGTGHYLDGLSVSNVKSLPGVSTGILLCGGGSIERNAIVGCSIGVKAWPGSFGSVQRTAVGGGDVGIWVEGNVAALSVGVNSVFGAKESLRIVSPDQPVSVWKNLFMQDLHGVTVYGGGSAGTVDLDQNVLHGDGQTGGAGLLVSTDAGAYGIEDTSVTLRRTEIEGYDVGVELKENPAFQANTLGLVIGNSLANACKIYNAGSYLLALRTCNDAIQAPSNYWGVNYAVLVESMILHKNDDPSLGKVTYLPICLLQPTLAQSAPPQIGTTVNLVASGGFENDQLVLLAGMQTTNVPLPPYLGALQVLPVLVLPGLLLGPGGSLSLPIPIPANPLLVGLQIHWQGLVGANLPLGVGGFSNVVTMTFVP
jgi:hypothetical protein